MRLERVILIGATGLWVERKLVEVVEVWVVAALVVCVQILSVKKWVPSEVWNWITSEWQSTL